MRSSRDRLPTPLAHDENWYNVEETRWKRNVSVARQPAALDVPPNFSRALSYLRRLYDSHARRTPHLVEYNFKGPNVAGECKLPKVLLVCGRHNAGVQPVYHGTCWTRRIPWAGYWHILLPSRMVQPPYARGRTRAGKRRSDLAVLYQQAQASESPQHATPFPGMDDLISLGALIDATW